MIKGSNYDFSGLESAMGNLKSKRDISSLKDIQKELDKFFTDSKCKEVIYTKNTDKLFFGMCVYAVLGKDEVNDILNDDRAIRIEKYFIEIDSKLFDIGLNNSELTAILLHEVGHLVNDSTPIEQVRKAIDVYLAENKMNISLKDSYDFNQFLGFAIRDSIRKFNSLFTRNDEEILADEFVFTCGYGASLESAYRKIVKSSGSINKNVSNKLIALDWSFQVYRNMKNYRIIALRALNKSKTYTASKLEQREIDQAVDSLKKIDTDSIRECYLMGEKIYVDESTITLVESEAIKNNGLIRKIQISGLRGLEEDVYEYQMRIRNVEDQDEAILLMRQLNTRMSVLDDYLMYASDIDAKERARWEKCFNKYDLLREELSKKTIYNKKNYGLWFDYNALDINR